MNAASEDIRGAFVAAYPSYVVSVLASRGVEVGTTIADAVVEGTAVLDAMLESLLSLGPAAQSRSPLELFREALRPVSRALDTVGVSPVLRDPGKVLAVPWDHHDLCPASPKALGDEAHDAHMRWGVAKASALGASPARNAPERPTVWVFANEPDHPVLESVLNGLGYRLGSEPSADRAVLALVDVDSDRGVAGLETALERRVRVIAYSESMDDIRATGLRTAGVWRVATRDDVLHRLGTLIPILA
jgi:hypothetical protein